MKTTVPVPRCKLGDTVMVNRMNELRIGKISRTSISISKDGISTTYEVDGVTGSVLESEIAGFCEVKPLIAQKRKRRTKKSMQQATEAVSAALEAVSNG